MAAPGRPTLSVRERRAWAKKLSEAQEAVESAEEARDAVMAAAYAAGIPFAGVEAGTGLGPHTVRNCINAANAR